MVEKRVDRNTIQGQAVVGGYQFLITAPTQFGPILATEAQYGVLTQILHVQRAIALLSIDESVQPFIITSISQQ